LIDAMVSAKSGITTTGQPPPNNFGYDQSRSAVIEIGREKLHVHDLRHTYASLSRRAGADLRLLQKAMGHASIIVTAHTYADLFDDELEYRRGARLSKRLLAEVSLAANDSGRRVRDRQRQTLDLPKSWAIPLRPRFRLFRCGWRAIPSSRRLISAR
jgi:hypothetical protein